MIGLDSYKIVSELFAAFWPPFGPFSDLGVVTILYKERFRNNVEFKDIPIPRIA